MNTQKPTYKELAIELRRALSLIKAFAPLADDQTAWDILAKAEGKE